jgi:hypothetical protein
MNEKYVLIKPYECQYGTIPSGSEIICFRGQVWVNGGPIPPSYNSIFLDLINNDEYVRKMKIQKNTF